jgi:predicted RNase H-like nuclease (RuvC/YqgF family)
MSEEMQTQSNLELTQLRKQVKDLALENGGLKDELKEVRGESRDRRHQLKERDAVIEGLTRERDELKVKSEQDPDGLRKQVADHQAVIRGLKHERSFEKVARTLSVNDPAKFADLVKLAGYQPEGEEPDEAKIAASFQEALKGRAWLVDQPAADAAKIAPGGANGEATVQFGARPGPGADRGQSLSSGQGQTTERISGRL